MYGLVKLAACAWCLYTVYCTVYTASDEFLFWKTSDVSVSFLFMREMWLHTPHNGNTKRTRKIPTSHSAEIFFLPNYVLNAHGQSDSQSRMNVSNLAAMIFFNLLFHSSRAHMHFIVCRSAKQKEIYTTIGQGQGIYKRQNGKCKPSVLLIIFFFVRNIFWNCFLFSLIFCCFFFSFFVLKWSILYFVGVFTSYSADNEYNTSCCTNW